MIWSICKPSTYLLCFISFFSNNFYIFFDNRRHHCISHDDNKTYAYTKKKTLSFLVGVVLHFFLVNRKQRTQEKEQDFFCHRLVEFEALIHWNLSQEKETIVRCVIFIIWIRFDNETKNRICQWFVIYSPRKKESIIYKNKLEWNTHAKF